MNVRWHPAAERSLLALPHWKTAAAVAEAVQRFATTGKGEVRRDPVRPGVYRLRASGFVVAFALEAGELVVLGLARG